RARELYFLSPVIDAHEAARIGLVNEVVPHDRFWERVMEVANRLAGGPPIAYARMKDNFVFGATHSLSETLTREAENHTFCGSTEDHRNAARAFVEKREPIFQGR
ncbi:MAG: enoyl-CoA hydratase-related protein, partial [Chloroflexota bacterium]|nr:enoyl-CoA hydratase-related protein [Chloroflexota bacterium]